MRFSFYLPMVALMALTFVTSPAAAQSDTYHDLEICVVHLIKDIDIPARETGLLKELNVEQNDAVELDQSIGQIDDQMAQRARELAQFKHSLAVRQFEDDTEIKSAQKKMELTDTEYVVLKRLFEKRSKTRFEYERALYHKQIAVLDHTAALNKQQLAGIQANTEMVNVKAAEDSINRHMIKSPIKGHVLQVYKDAGEWVNAGEKIARVAPLAKLRVHGSMPTASFDPREVDGKPVLVTLTRARGTKVTFKGKVILTSLENQGGTKYQVIAEVENRLDEGGKHFMLQPGSSVNMRIYIDGEPPQQFATQN